jgi:hypothetical protein
LEENTVKKSQYRNEGEREELSLSPITAYLLDLDSHMPISGPLNERLLAKRSWVSTTPLKSQSHSLGPFANFKTAISAILKAMSSSQKVLLGEHSPISSTVGFGRGVKRD